jgi:transposase
MSIRADSASSRSDLAPLSWTPHSLQNEEFTTMAKSKFAKRYAPEFRAQLVQLHRAGRPLGDLAREFGCSSWAISRWVRQSARDAGGGDGGLTTDERAELARLRAENKRLRLEREILGKAAAWFAQETAVPNTRRSSGS